MHEMSNPVFWGNKKNIISLSSAEFAHSIVSVKNGIKVLSYGRRLGDSAFKEKK